jgi:hypothetical protein
MAKSATMTIDSTKIDPAALWEIENILYGSPEAPPRLPLPHEIVSIIKQEGLIEDPNDPGTFMIMYGSMVEDPEDPGTFDIVKLGVEEDPDEPGTYEIGVA